MKTTAGNSLKTALRTLALEAGAQAAGFARACPVDTEAAEAFDRWIAEGRHCGMGYMENYSEVRRDPRLLLEPDTSPEKLEAISGGYTVMVCAFSYYHPECQESGAARIAMYAHGSDYHDVLRRRLRPLAAYLEELGLKARVCIDTAPLRERYWAVRAGVGFIGRNGQLIVDGMGSYFFLATVIFNAPVEPDGPCRRSCMGCGRCVIHCPGQALGPDGIVDARRCLSYLTIEHRGELPHELHLPDGSLRPMAEALGGRVYGCDECQRVCPHNAAPPETAIEEFRLRPTLRSLTAEEILRLTPEGFASVFKGSAVKRAKLSGLQRNATAIAGKYHGTEQADGESTPPRTQT